MEKWKCLAIIFSNVATICIVSSERVVMTSSGPVRSTTLTFSSSEVDAFLGIPYAKPPVEKLRFSKPVPISPWDEIYNATKKPPPCYQNASQGYYWMPNTENMTEDCLYLNIWVPASRQDVGLKSVLVWIHGGAFNLGSSEMDLYDGAMLADYGDVIVASMNYRVAVFGFFTAFIEDADGNMGIYDQIMALKWLKNNIEAFGGNPEEITLIGESAGAMSVGTHLISPLTKNLFKRAIMESGAAVHPMSTYGKVALLKNSNNMAKMVGCADKEVNLTTNPQIVVDCLKRLPAQVLSTAEGLMITTNPITFFPRWGDSFMPNDTVELLREGRYKETEVLMGINKDEGSFFLTVILPQFFGVYGHNGVEKVSKRTALTFIRGIFQFTEQNNTSEIANYYVNNIKNMTTISLKKALYDSLGDYMIACNNIFHADFHSLGKKPVYFYMFTHRPSTAQMANWVGTTHYDEVQYVFGQPLRKEVNYTSEEEALSRRIMDRWLAFAKTGNPNIQGAITWPAYTFENPMYLDINLEETVQIRPDDYRCEFWRDRFNAQIDIPRREAFDNKVSAAYSKIYSKWTIIVGIIIFIVCL